METKSDAIPEMLAKYETELLSDWVKSQSAAVMRRSGTVDEVALRRESAEMLGLMREAARSGVDVTAPGWLKVRDALTSLSRARAREGYSPSETATFLFSLKRPLFERIVREYGKDAKVVADVTWTMSVLLDDLGLYTTEAYQRGREEVIGRQQQELLELSTPVVKLWDGILALPLIGTLDSNRTQVVMENLLREIVRTGCSIAIIDITGVPLVDTLVAQHLLKTIAAARLMGADCIISGIRPQIAQTIVHLGVELNNVVTKASLADAFRLALNRTGLSVAPLPSQAQN